MRRFLLLVCLAVTLSLAYGQASSAWCSTQKTCNSNSECAPLSIGDNPFTQACCAGQCRDGFPPMGLGDVCDAYKCAGDCFVGTCSNGRCQRPTTGRQLGCHCNDDAQCLGVCLGSVNGTDGTCSGENLPAAAPCRDGTECMSGTCTNGVCEAVASGDTCTQPDTSGMPWECDGNNVCLSREGTDPPICGTPRLVGGYCERQSDCSVASTEPTERLACNTTSNRCVYRYSGVQGQLCNHDAMCENGVCADGKCSGFHDVNDGDDCYADENCKSGSRCLGSGAHKTCVRVVGVDCDADGPSICGDNAECQCVGGVRTECRATPNTNRKCQDEYWDFYAYTAMEFADFSNQHFNLFPDAYKSIAANFFCCIYRGGGGFEAQFAYLDAGQYLTAGALDCSVNPPVWSELDPTAGRCSAVDTVPPNDVIKGVNHGPNPRYGAGSLSPASTLAVSHTLLLAVLIALSSFLLL